MTKTYFPEQEVKERREARSTAVRTGNYRSDPFQQNEVVEIRPSNCYGCTWIPITSEPDKGKYRLKFTHKLCYQAHVRNEASS